MPLQVEQASEAGVTIIKFLDKRIAEENDIIEFGEELVDAVAGEHEKVLVNLGEVDFLSSAAIGKLVMIHKKAKANSVDLKFCCINSPNPFEGFKICNLDTLFDIKDTQEEAIAAFG